MADLCHAFACGTPRRLPPDHTANDGGFRRELAA